MDVVGGRPLESPYVADDMAQRNQNVLFTHCRKLVATLARTLTMNVVRNTPLL
jgi:hypothetical protein